MKTLFGLVGPLVRLLDPERAHRLTVCALAHSSASSAQMRPRPRLKTEVLGLSFPNPLGLAAGFDKDGEVTDAMLGLGFGFVEAGSVTPYPQPGNPRPRLFRLTEDQGVINRMGFNNSGMDRVRKHLDRRRSSGIVGVNLGRNKTSDNSIRDYVLGVERFAPVADYLVVNVSSPNTPGLRALQGRESLSVLLQSVIAARNRADRRLPLLLKIAPDLTDGDREDIARTVLESDVDGMICTNTTIRRPDALRSRWRDETGGLSGRPLFTLATSVLADMYRLTGGRVPIIGVGGIEDADTAYAKIRAGASLLQLYSALVYRGPGLVNGILNGLEQRLQADGFATLGQAVGALHRRP